MRVFAIRLPEISVFKVPPNGSGSAVTLGAGDAIKLNFIFRDVHG